MRIQETYKHWCNERLQCFREGKFRYKEILCQFESNSKRILHFGCGRDLSNVTELFLNTDTFVGVDVDREALEQYPAPSWRLTRNVFPFADAAFDLVVSEFVLEHLEHPDQVFREIFRVLAPGGRFITVAPNWWSYKSIAAWLIPNRLHAWFVRTLRPESLREGKDVYPTYFRANSARSLRRLARNGDVELVRLEFCNNGPTWFRRIPALFELGLLAHKAMDLPALASLRCNLIVEYRKQGEGKRTRRIFTCVDCGGLLDGAFPESDLTCTQCGRVYVVREGVYA